MRYHFNLTMTIVKIASTKHQAQTSFWQIARKRFIKEDRSEMIVVYAFLNPLEKDTILTYANQYCRVFDDYGVIHESSAGDRFKVYIHEKDSPKIWWHIADGHKQNSASCSDRRESSVGKVTKLSSLSRRWGTQLTTFWI